jgi:glutamate racemase
MKIGLFDSGLGGLTILRAVVRALPEHDYYYYGDTANLPYGDKTEAHIYELSVAAMEYLFGQGCALVVIACNTASAETLRKLQDEYLPTHYPERRILGVIIPTVEVLVAGAVRCPLLIATTRTVESGKYERELEKSGGTLSLTARATPGLVPLIEAGKGDVASTEAIAAIDAVLASNPQIDSLVLGCTHYTELKNDLRAYYAARLRIFSQDEIIPEKLRDYIARHPELEREEGGGSIRSIHLTEHRPDYDRVIAQLLGGMLVSED